MWFTKRIWNIFSATANLFELYWIFYRTLSLSDNFSMQVASFMISRDDKLKAACFTPLLLKNALQMLIEVCASKV